MDRDELRDLIYEIYDDYDFANFTLHFVDEVEPGKVYEIKNNRIYNKLKETTLIGVSGMVTKEQMNALSLYGVNVKEHIIREMIEQSANKILTDIYKVNTQGWFYSRPDPVDIELTIANWHLYEEETAYSFEYKLKFLVA